MSDAICGGAYATPGHNNLEFRTICPVFFFWVRGGLSGVLLWKDVFAYYYEFNVVVFCTPLVVVRAKSFTTKREKIASENTAWCW